MARVKDLALFTGERIYEGQIGRRRHRRSIAQARSGMEPDDPLCLCNALKEKDGEGSGQVPFLLAEPPR
jgi:hypothetical protein